ncbi:hypothetical protein CFN78_03375 [Amycolatopsis antarctica]|uniref:Uncharacterized protein n=1 Tax=Amycolatopsis antarctica TaxID=1854586 RepID=A0A263D9R3_9PSEU|nr:hypothetical protein [Amycolatopsis antarctica]OZM75213.1 hypothetical protein CFN78_03375 [Amycolatopsis antarctica]
MPIRTNRGRAAVYRRLWGWPVRSPKHLVGTVIVVAVLVTGLGIAVPKLFPDREPQGIAAVGQDREESQRQSSQAPPSTPMPTRLTSPRESPTPAAPNPQALDVAKKWATAWVNHPAGVTVEQWLAGMKPFTTEEYLPVMSSVDPANVPATKLTGEPTAATSYTSSVEVLIPTDGPRLSITVITTNAGWRVAQYEQAD